MLRKKRKSRRAGTELGDATRKLGEAESAARAELVKAGDFLNEAIKEASNWKALQADAHNWIGRIHALSPIDDFDKADEHFEKSVQLIDSRHPYWPELTLDRVKNSLEFARRHLVPGRVNLAKARPLILQAIAQVEPLATHTAATVHDRHRIAARGIVLQGRLWLGDSSGADKAYSALATGLSSTDDRATASLEAARRILALSRDPDTARLLNEKERDLANRSFAELLALAPQMSFQRKWDFYRANRDYYLYWNDRATLGKASIRRSPREKISPSPSSCSISSSSTSVILLN